MTQISLKIAVYAQRDWGLFEGRECLDVVLPAWQGVGPVERARNPNTKGQ
jgi:hypothetical protein